MPETVTEQLRRIVRASGATQHQIAREAGVPQPRLSTFLAGGGLKSDTLDALARWAGVRLTRPRKALTTEREKR